MIRLNRVSEGSLEDLSFEFSPGHTAKILLASHDRKNELLAVLSGLRRPRAGSVFLLGEDLYALKEKERLRLFQRIGVVPENGGMIGNLKAWENLVLPVWYHLGAITQETERAALKLFRLLDLDESELQKRLAQLPDQLTLYEKRAVALVRAMLMEPDVIVYDFIFAGLGAAASSRIRQLTQEFHGGKDGRISVHLCADDAVSASLPADHSIALTY